MLSMRRSMDWTLEDNMVDGLFFCATLTGRRGGHTPFIQAGVETSDTGAEAIKPDPGSCWEGHSGGGCRCRGWKCGVSWGCPPTPHSIGDPPTEKQLNLHGICIAVIIKSNYVYNGCAWIKKGLWQPEEDFFFVGFFFSSCLEPCGPWQLNVMAICARQE